MYNTGFGCDMVAAAVGLAIIPTIHQSFHSPSQLSSISYHSDTEMASSSLNSRFQHTLYVGLLYRITLICVQISSFCKYGSFERSWKQNKEKYISNFLILCRKHMGVQAWTILISKSRDPQGQIQGQRSFLKVKKFT